MSKLNSEIMRERWRDPEYRERMVNIITERARTPEARAQSSANAKRTLTGTTQGEAQRAKSSASTAATWTDPEIRRKRTEAITKAIRARIAAQREGVRYER